jgi:UDP-N-acetylmuramoyl-tripeptide--D-alanyl-D-alanine ligase
MSTLNLANIAACLGVTSLADDADVASVVIDSRHASPGALFAALPGASVDGHDFLDHAHAKGAVAALVSQACPHSPIPVLQVPDVSQALGQLATWWRQQLSDCKVVAITGSCGKTTTKQVLAQLLSRQAKTHSTLHNQNNELGVPLTLLALRPEHRYAVIEMGAGAPGDIAYLSAMATPDVAVITTIAEAHLDGFGDLEGVAHAKSEISRGLVSDGTLILNHGIAESQIAAKQKKPKQALLWFGRSEVSAIHASDVHATAQGVRCQVHLPDGTVHAVQCPLLGDHNVDNLLAAMAAAYVLGVAPAEMVAGLATVQASAQRLLPRPAYAGALIIDDAYNASPAATKAAIKTLASFPGKRKILVMGEMLSLGDMADVRHQEVAQWAQESSIDALYAVGELCRSMAQAFGEHGHYFESKQALIEALRSTLAADDVVLVKGSRGSAMDTVVAALLVETNK